MFVRGRVLAMITTTAIVIAACSSAGGATPPSSSASTHSPTASNGASTSPVSGSITVYNAQHESLTKEWVDAFTKETGIKVTLRNGDDTELANQIVAGGRGLAGRRLPHRELAGHGAGRERRPVRRRRRRPRSTRCPPSTARPPASGPASPPARTVLAYNKTKLTADQLPKSMLDLAEPEWKGRWARVAVGRRLPGDRLRRCSSSRARPPRRRG